MTIAIITGSAGLIGSEAASFFSEAGLDILGIDNDMRRRFFGDEASTAWNRDRLERSLGRRYRHFDLDIRDSAAIDAVFRSYGPDTVLIIHTAAQPSHDWAALEPMTDFTVNAAGTMNLLESCRAHCPDAPFIYTSTNKVYGDAPNRLPLVELKTRWEIDPDHTYANGIREDMSIDHCLHSLFGVSKAAADLMVQEYGRYFGLKTSCFRGGCLTGPNHSGTQLHGFLAYLMKCAMSGTSYTIFGYKGKQVRDNIHSGDLINCFDHVLRDPRSAEVYNIGGGRFSNASMLEAIDMCQEITGMELDWSYSDSNRIGDHIWWISDNSRFASHYPDWHQKYGVREILKEIYEKNRTRWTPETDH